MQANFDRELQSYFTDVEHLREMFHQWLAAAALPKRLLVIHGVGGVGKSSLLRMLRLHCKSVKIPIGLASGDEQKSVLDVLYFSSASGKKKGWVADLKADGIRFPKFDATYERYREILAKVNAQLKREVKNAGQTMVKTASIAGEAAGGALAAAVISSVIPGFGAVLGTVIGSMLGSIGVDQLTDWLLSRGFKKSEIDLLLEPDQKLTEDFLTDLMNVASKQRLVLMLDTFEQMEALSDWTRDMAQRLHSNILLVIAGRAVPNWDRIWHGWMANAHIEELKPMTDENMRELIRRYYATLRGGEPDPKQVEAIIAFARGLPMVVTSAVQLWVKYDVEDFQAVKPKVIPDLVDRLLEGVPKQLVPALEAAAILRWFDQPILRAVLKQEDVREVYNELWRFPFVRPSAEGLALHDAVREIIDENLREQDADRHRELHERAAAYFDNLIGRLKAIPGLSDEWQRLAMERAYHLLRADEESGMSLLHKLFEQGLFYFRYQFCQTLLTEAESLPLRAPKSIHRLKYNKIRLRIVEFSPAYVSDQEFRELVENSDLDLETKWEVLLDYAWFIGFTAADFKTQAKYFWKSLEALRDFGQEETVAGCVVLSAISSSLGDEPAKREEFAKRALEISQKIGEPFYAYSPYVELGHTYLDMGDYAKAEEMWRAAVAIAHKSQNKARIADSLNRLAHATMAQGKLAETEEILNAAMEAAKRLPNTLGAGRDKEMYIKRHYGILYYMKGEYDRAVQYFLESAQIYRERGSIGGRLRTLGLLANCLYEAGRRDQIERLAPEIESLIPKMQAHETVASWLIVQAHMLLDDALEDKVELNQAIEKYCETLRIALESHHIVVLDEMLNRIMWRLEQVAASSKAQEATLIIDGLIRCWREGRINGKPLTDVESEQRQKFIGPARESFLLPRLEAALNQGIPKCKSTPWLSF